MKHYLVLKAVGITSYGQGYNQPPQLVVLDGVSRAKDPDADLRYNLATPDREDMLILLKTLLV